MTLTPSPAKYAPPLLPRVVMREDLLSEVYEGKLRVFTDVFKGKEP